MAWTLEVGAVIDIASVIVPCDSVEVAIAQNRAQTTLFPIHLHRDTYDALATCIRDGVSLHSQGKSCLQLLEQYEVPVYDERLTIRSASEIENNILMKNSDEAKEEVPPKLGKAEKNEKKKKQVPRKK